MDSVDGIKARDFRVVHPSRCRPLPATLGFGQFFGDYAVIVDYERGRGWFDPRVVPFHPWMARFESNVNHGAWTNLDLVADHLAQVIPEFAGLDVNDVLGRVPKSLLAYIAHLEGSVTSLAAVHRHYAKGLFEGTKMFMTPEDVLLHRDRDNRDRMNRGCTYLGMPQVPKRIWDLSLRLLAHFIKMAGQLPVGDDVSLYVRPMLLATQEIIGVQAGNKFQFIVICSPSGPYYAAGMEPVKIAIETRCARVPPGMIGSLKSMGNYHDTVMDPVAVANGCKQRIWLAAEDFGKPIVNRRIEEVGTSGFGVFVRRERRGGIMFRTPSGSRGTILRSHTMSSAEQLIGETGDIMVIERDMTVGDIVHWHRNGQLLGAIGTGTAASVGGISSIFIDGEELRIHDGGRGQRTLDLYKRLTDIQYGRAPDLYGWNRSAHIDPDTE